MLDVLDLIVERGGNPAAVKESQRVRFSSSSSPETIGGAIARPATFQTG